MGMCNRRTTHPSKISPVDEKSPLDERSSPDVTATRRPRQSHSARGRASGRDSTLDGIPSATSPNQSTGASAGSAKTYTALVRSPPVGTARYCRPPTA